jgi:peptidoglycan-associated lipoprotein
MRSEEANQCAAHPTGTGSVSGRPAGPAAHCRSEPHPHRAGSAIGTGRSPGRHERSAGAPPSVPVDPPVVTSDPLDTAEIDKINADSPLKPALFAYDSDELDEVARQVISKNAEVLKKYPTWIITIEGHCDERGTAEYNLALGDRRALAAKNYLVSLGIPAERVRTVSYGSEFPFDPGHEEKAWIQNRRAHFMLTARSK